MKGRVEYRRLIRRAIAIIEAERESSYASYKSADGVVRGRHERAEIRKYDRWLEAAKAAVA